MNSSCDRWTTIRLSEAGLNMGCGFRIKGTALDIWYWTVVLEQSLSKVYFRIITMMTFKRDCSLTENLKRLYLNFQIMLKKYFLVTELMSCKKYNIKTFSMYLYSGQYILFWYKCLFGQWQHSNLTRYFSANK